MSSDALSFLSGVFEVLFSIFTSWHIPGTNVTPAMWFVFLLSVGVLFRFLGKLGFGKASIDDVSNVDRLEKRD